LADRQAADRLTDAERVHTALCRTWERLCDALDDARFERREGYIWTICPQVPLAAFNGVWPETDEAAPALVDALREIAELELPYSIQVRRGLTPACELEAERLGLMMQEETPAMLMRPDELRGVDVRSLQVVKATTADTLAQALATAADAFGAPPEAFAALYGLDVTGLDKLIVYIGRVGDVDVSTATGYTVGGATAIFNVATPPSHRGHGFGGAITTCAVREGFSAGAEFAWLQSSDAGYSVYERLGFRTVDTYRVYAAPETPFVEL
jgi:ribosomal protein S18 acetylase RimI-like enzyme